ncbi:SDR family NAD(P)-dependent oxidoreductase [Croceicoccus ponticola]|uniref:SDR family NAD(P)-dependent oxidoreductase n=1 Tax=Croceicoccus ponticola TaxID=2217664 RepID=A0A437H085_9SPHN|nr:SDR family NAD(P)-dependent oxidoreductase [Croceicoccus ponticola]RVQ69027.1 SDR family NAD(P)-dependent oxidoreductase [Croceicoccus ponticola]
MRCAVFGAGGGIGAALVARLEARDDVSVVYSGSRSQAVPDSGKRRSFRFDLTNEASIADAAETMVRNGPLDLVIVATGILQDEPAIRPERTWSAIDPDAMARVFAINATGPAVVAKHMLPRLSREGAAKFAVLSARVGSIGDNRLGGWHAYRASKAALNMLVRNFAIELGRRNPGALAVVLHPGTVDTSLSAPFQANVGPEKLFDADRAAMQLLNVLESLSPAQSGSFFAWDGSPIPW